MSNWEHGKAMAEKYVAKDQTLTEGDVRRGQEIAGRLCRRGLHELRWCGGCGDGMCPCTEGHELSGDLCDVCGPHRPAPCHERGLRHVVGSEKDGVMVCKVCGTVGGRLA